MKIQKEWDAPQECWNGCSDVKFEFEGLNAKLIISFSKNKLQQNIVIRFFNVVCYRHESNFLFMPGNGTLECLCKVVNSEWIQNLKSINSQNQLDELNHFVYDNQNDGRFEIIAKNYIVD